MKSIRRKLQIDTDLYMLAGREKRASEKGQEDDGAKDRGQDDESAKDKTETKEGGQGVIQALPFSRHYCREPLLTSQDPTDQETPRNKRMYTWTHKHALAFTAPLMLLKGNHSDWVLIMMQREA